MLSRVAWHLYWLSRYLERAENIARILGVTQNVLLLPASERTASALLEPLIITDTLEAYRQIHPRATPTWESVAEFLAWHPDHPSSIVHCLSACRENAKAVRGSITIEMWECINDTWLDLHKLRASGNGGKKGKPSAAWSGLPVNGEYFDWVKTRSHLYRGVTLATTARGQAYLFNRLGTFIERADNTARILMVKQVTQALQMAENQRNPISDYYQLGAVLRSLSAMEAYNDIYRDKLTAERLAELLLFNETLPRSLRHCLNEIAHILSDLPNHNAKDVRRYIALLQTQFMYDDLNDVLRTGLHPYMESFLSHHLELAEAIGRAYLDFS